MGDDQALREQIAQAVHSFLFADGSADASDYQIADAVLPVVQAHEKALRDEVLKYRNAICWDVTCLNCSKLLDRCYADTQRAETAEEALDSLRDAVAHLAAEYQARADDDPWDDPSVESVAERLRSLLPQEGQK